MRSYSLLSSLLLVALGLAVLASCSLGGNEENSSPQVPPPIDFSRFSQDSSLLVGRWEWKRSTVYGPGEPGVSTPSTADRTETLVFSSPPDSVRVYRSDTLYQYTSRTSFFKNEIKWGVHHDTLATSSAALDGPQKIYERVE